MLHEVRSFSFKSLSFFLFSLWFRPFFHACLPLGSNPNYVYGWGGETRSWGGWNSQKRKRASRGDQNRAMEVHILNIAPPEQNYEYAPA